MSEIEKTASELAKTASKKVGKANDTKDALKGAKSKVENTKSKMGVLKEAGKQLKALAKDFKNLDKKEKICRIGGLVALVTLGLILKRPEDAAYFAKGIDKVDEHETLEDTETEKTHAEAKKEAEKKVEEGKMSEEEMAVEFDPKADEVISKKQSASNMYAIRYYNKDGSIHAKPNGLARICKKEKVIPSKFILKGSMSLFKEGVGSFSDFKKNVTDKLVKKEITDPKERIRQAAVILSCCAVGRFQIVPTFHFKKMGWKTRGEEGLKDMYDYIRSTDRQIANFKNILSASWNKYEDVGLVAVAYYAGEGTAKGYKKNPSSAAYHNKQYAGHDSIHDYAEKARKNFNKFKAEIPGLEDLDYAAMTIESNETGKGIIYSRAKKGTGISNMNVA